MAKQDAAPPAWRRAMSDGCTFVFNLGFRTPCERHDHRYQRGGDTEDKTRGDDCLYEEMKDPKYVESKFWRWQAEVWMAGERWKGVRLFTYNYAPDDPRRFNMIGRSEAFNWLGPGPSEEERKRDEEYLKQAAIRAAAAADLARVRADERARKRRKYGR